MTWFWIFGGGFFAGWWMCAATWPSSDRCPRRPPESSYGSRLDPGRIQRSNAGDTSTTPKPDIIPKPQFPSPRTTREDFLP